LDWPGVQQVCVLERSRRSKDRKSQETVYAITSLSAERASAKRLLQIARQHWQIENGLHWVRDVTFGEDACRVRTRAAPQILAGLRNAVLYLLRNAGLSNLAAALRQHAARAHEAIHLVATPTPTRS
jgi:predicted transposase YbfD/YdcC